MKHLTEVRLNTPLSWSELSNKQKLYIASLQLTYSKGPDLLVRSFLFCTGLKKIVDAEPVTEAAEREHWYRYKKSKPFLIPDTVILEAASKMNYLLREPINYTPLPRIRRAKPLHYRLYNAIFEQYLMAENFFMAFTKTDDVAHLNCLCVVLHTRHFQKWDSSLIKKRSKYFTKVSMAEKTTVYTWYISFRNYVASECPNLQKPSSNGEEPKMKEMVRGMVRMLNKGDIKGNETIYKAPVWDALYELEAQAEEYEKQKEAIDNVRRS